MVLHFRIGHDLKNFVVLYDLQFAGYELLSVCDAYGLAAVEPSKSLLETSINFSTPLLLQNHVSLNV